MTVSGPNLVAARRSKAATFCLTTSSKNMVASWECSRERNSKEIWEWVRESQKLFKTMLDSPWPNAGILFSVFFPCPSNSLEPLKSPVPSLIKKEVRPGIVTDLGNAKRELYIQNNCQQYFSSGLTPSCSPVPHSLLTHRKVHSASSGIGRNTRAESPNGL